MHTCASQAGTAAYPGEKSPELREGGPELAFCPVSATCNLAATPTLYCSLSVSVYKISTIINPKLEGSEITHTQRQYLGRLNDDACYYY